MAVSSPESLKKIMTNFDINLKWEKNDKKSKIRYTMLIYQLSMSSVQMSKCYMSM